MYWQFDSCHFPPLPQRIQSWGAQQAVLNNWGLEHKPVPTSWAERLRRELPDLFFDTQAPHQGEVGST